MKSQDTFKEPDRTLSDMPDEAKNPVPETPDPARVQSAPSAAAQYGGTSHQFGQPSFLSDQDEVATPVPFTMKPMAAPRAGQPDRAMRPLKLVAGLCLFVSLLSLALSGFLLFSLLKVRQTVDDGLDTAIQAIDSLKGNGLQYEYLFERLVPVSASIPIEQDLAFPFRGDIPINTTVKVPINAGILGTFNVEIPINTTVAVDTSVPLKVDQRFEVSTTIPISMAIPIDVQPDDPAIQELLGQVRKWLVQLQKSF